MDLDEFTRRNTRRCSVLKACSDKSLGSPTDSHFALAPVACAGEAWPMHNGRPLTFVCQLNLTQAPIVPDALRDVTLITFWFDDDELDTDQANGSGWQLRAYSSLDGLAPLAAPPGYASELDGLTAQWHDADDQPTTDDPDIVGLDAVDEVDIELHTLVGTKLGGYPSLMTGPPEFGGGARYVLQIDTEDAVGFTVADSGCIFIGRVPGTKPEDPAGWRMQWQCF